MNSPTVQQIIGVMKKKKYNVFKNPKGHDINIVGIRTADTRASRFNDWLTVFYLFERVWNYFAFPATTDPGLFYRRSPLNVKGTAVMKPGQYRGVYMVGKHKGYKALQQKGKITVYRDNNKNDIIDTVGMIEETGFYGVNIHHASAYRPSVEVGRWSAGCQVLQDPDHFAFLMRLCDRAVGKFANSFTYTLLEEKDFS